MVDAGDSIEAEEAELAAAAVDLKAELLGNRLYSLIYVEHGLLAGKITGMLLQALEHSQLVAIIDDQVALQSRIQEAVEALEAHQAAAKRDAAAVPVWQNGVVAGACRASDEVATESSGGAGMADAIDHHAKAMGAYIARSVMTSEGSTKAPSAAGGSERRARPSDAVATESSRGAGEFYPLQVSLEEFARQFFTKREDAARFLHRNNPAQRAAKTPHPSAIQGKLPAPSAVPLLQLPWREGTVERAVVCELLCRYGRDAAHQRNHRGNTALHLAVENRASCSVVEELLAANPEAASIANEDGWRPLHLAATNHAGLDIVADLLYASPSAVRTVDNTAAYLPLHCAAQSGADGDVILGLLKAYPEAASVRNKGGGTALHLAAWTKSKLAVIQILLKACPQAAEWADKAGWLPLHCAVQRQPPNDCANQEVIEELLRAFPDGASVANSHGELPLHLAVKSKAGVEIVRLLLRAHPQAAKTPGQAGLLPLHLAAGKRAGFAVVTALLKVFAAATGVASEDGDLPLHLAAGDSELKVIQSLLNANPGAARMPGQDGDTALHIAVGNNAEMCVVKALIAAHPGAAWATNNDMDMPLHVAVANKAGLDIIAALTHAWPAAVSITSSNITSSDVGWLPLEYAKAILDGHLREESLDQESYMEHLQALQEIENCAYSSLDDSALQEYERSLKTQTRVFGKSHETLRSFSQRFEQQAIALGFTGRGRMPGAGGLLEQQKKAKQQHVAADLQHQQRPAEEEREREANHNMQMLLQEIMDEETKEAKLAEKKKGKKKKKKDSRAVAGAPLQPAVLEQLAPQAAAERDRGGGERVSAGLALRCETSANLKGAANPERSQGKKQVHGPKAAQFAGASAVAVVSTVRMSLAQLNSPEGNVAAARVSESDMKDVHEKFGAKFDQMSVSNAAPSPAFAACMASEAVASITSHGMRTTPAAGATSASQVHQRSPEMPVVRGASVDHVCDWLVGMELGEYRDIFHANKIDWEMLQELQEEDLVNDFGMANKYHRRRFLAKRSICSLPLSPTLSAPALAEAAEKRECVICLRSEVAGWVIMRPCGHVCVCTECETGLDKCPVCRQHISERFQAFL